MARKQNPADENVWLRQSGESEKAFVAFQTFLDLGDERTVTAVAKKLSKSRQLIDRWAQLYEWRNRAQAYDNYIVSAKAKKTRKEVEARYERFGRLSDQYAAYAATLLKTVDPKTLTHKEALGYANLALKLANANREMFTLTEVEQTRTDVELLRIETTQSSGGAASGTSNFEDALMTVTPDIWDDDEKEDSDDEPLDNE